jgi:hypothetical protein
LSRLSLPHKDLGFAASTISTFLQVHGRGIGWNGDDHEYALATGAQGGVAATPLHFGAVATPIRGACFAVFASVSLLFYADY